MPAKIEISHKTILFTIFFLIVLWALVEVKEIIFMVFVSFILMSAFKPWADFFERFHIPRLISVLLIYLIVILFIVFVGSSIIPPLVAESIRLGESLPYHTKSVLPFLQIDSQTITQQIAPLGQNLLKVSVGIFSNLIALFSVFVISFYLTLERSNLDTHLVSFMGESGAHRISVIIKKVEDRLGAWVRGQVTLVVVIGISTYVGLTLLGIPYTLALSILAGLLEIVPTIGPIISAIPAILVALTISPFLALATTALYFIIQQAENHLIVPIVMKKVVGVPPLLTIIAIMIGAKLAGIGGAILAIPVAVSIESILSEYLKVKESH